MITTAYIADMAASLRDMLGDDFDEVTFLDTLEGETDAMDIADRLIASALDADAMSEAIKAQEAELRARRDRMESRANAYRHQMMTLLDAIGVKKLERPRATISKRAGSTRVVIVDDAAIPSQLCKVVQTPDKAAIKAQLQAGEAVPGAAFEMGPDSLSVRVK